MLLCIDAGNTQTVIGLFDDAELVDHWRIATVAERTADELALMIQQFLGFHGFSPFLVGAPGGASADDGSAAPTPVFDEHIDGVAISSGVPRVTVELRAMTERYFGFPALVLEPGVRTGMPILYDNPKEVGADRIANAVAAYDLYGGPSIVVDFGTANTIEAISEQGEYLGGAIFPGIEISMDALFGRAAALRRVELLAPRNVIGKSTVESIQSGTVYGYSGQVDALVDRFQAELGHCTVLSTGGLAEPIIKHSRTIQHYEPWLTLQGLRIIFERNR
jgi:type III pantothenate kinase